MNKKITTSATHFISKIDTQPHSHRHTNNNDTLELYRERESIESNARFFNNLNCPMSFCNQQQMGRFGAVQFRNFHENSICFGWHYSDAIDCSVPIVMEQGQAKRRTCSHRNEFCNDFDRILVMRRQKRQRRRGRRRLKKIRLIFR